MSEILLSYDVETTGPVPGSNALLSLGIVAIDGNALAPIGEYAVNLDIDYDKTGISVGWDEDTRHWWMHPDRAEAWAETRKDLADPKTAIPEMVKWLKKLRQDHDDAKLVWAAYPATFDFPFIAMACHRFAPTAWLRLSKDDVMQRVAGFDMGSQARAS